MVDAYLTEDNRIAGNFSIKQSLPDAALVTIKIYLQIKFNIENFDDIIFYFIFFF